MSGPLTGLQDLLRTLSPTWNPGVYVFVSVPEGVVADASRAIASIREPEGLSLVLAETDAAAQGLVVQFRAAWLTLTVHSALEAVGLTAAFASALAEAGIGCNVVAGSFHDHLFVPYERAAEAMAVLADIQQQANDR